MSRALRIATALSLLAVATLFGCFAAWLEGRDLAWIGIAVVLGGALTAAASVACVWVLMKYRRERRSGTLETRFPLRYRRVFASFAGIFLAAGVCLIGFARYSQSWLLVVDNRSDVAISEIRLEGQAAPKPSLGSLAPGARLEKLLVPGGDGAIFVSISVSEVGQTPLHVGIQWSSYAGLRTGLALERGADHKLLIKETPAPLSKLARILSFW